MLIQKSFAGDNEPWRAEAALRGIVIDKGLLDGVQLVPLHQRLDRSDLLALGFDGQHGTGIDSLVIHQHGTSAALGTITDALGAREIELVA